MLSKATWKLYLVSELSSVQAEPRRLMVEFEVKPAVPSGLMYSMEAAFFQASPD